MIVDLGFGDRSAEFPDFAVLQGGKYLDSLKQTGVSPDEVDTVVYTHFHLDHVGWTTSGGSLTFPNARHIAGEAEWAHWQQPDESGLGPDPEAVIGPLSDRIEHAGDGEAIAPGINLMGTPGHTPGHNSVVISSGSERAIILGDVIWCPVQIPEQEWALAFDVDPELAGRTREAMIRELEGSAAIACGSHFADASFGRVLTGEGKRQWQVTT